MKALIVGLGSIGRRHARNWAQLGLGPVAVCRQVGRELPEELGVDAEVFSNLDDALGSRPDIVFVTNPSSLHVETARLAIDAGCHVFIEKPIGSSLEGLADLLDAARARGKHVVVGYNLRFHPGLARLRELLSTGAIGIPLSARCEVGEYLPDWHPWEDFRQSYSARGDQGGGPILTFSHEIDSACWLFGRPTSVVCMADRLSRLEIDTEDVAEILLRFEAGPIVSIHMDYVRRLQQRSIEVTGDRGIARWEMEANRVLLYADTARAWRVEEGDPRYARNDMFLAELQHVAACLRGEIDRPLVDGRQGAAVLTIALAARQAATDGRRIVLEDDPHGWLSSLGQR